MKATGVVRRIDDLGRIVIPKEMRRTLRIRDGESLEIFVDEDFVALKKYSPLNDMANLAKTLVDSVHSSIGKNILVTDKDRIIAFSGTASLKKKYLDKGISSYLLEILKTSNILYEEDAKSIPITKNEDEKCVYYICPIIMNGDAIGLVMLFADSGRISNVDQKLVQLTAQILGKHIEE